MQQAAFLYRAFVMLFSYLTMAPFGMLSGTVASDN